MMGAGPVPIPAAVAKANTIVINHLGGAMVKVIGQVKTMARYVFQTQSKWVLGVAGPGSAAMEMAISNLAWEGTRVLCIKNGFFSDRMGEMGRRVGARVSTLEVADRSVASLEQIAEAIRRERPEVVTVVQGETSNTVWNYHLKDIAALAKAAGALVIVDAVCTLSTMPLEMDAWGIDAVITGGQKGLSSIPGVSLIAFSDAAWARVKGRTAPNAHWCLDASLAENFWHNAGYHYTAPVSGVLALHEALRLVCAETLEKRFARHLKCSSGFAAGGHRVGLAVVCARGLPIEFGGRDRSARWFDSRRCLLAYLAAASGGNLGLVWPADCPHRPDGRAVPRTQSFPYRPCAGPDDGGPRREGRFAGGSGGAGTRLVGREIVFCLRSAQAKKLSCHNAAGWLVTRALRR